MSGRWKDWVITGGFVGVVAVLVGLGWASRDHFSAPEGGESAPVFEATALNGDTVGLQDYAGKVILLNIWATWCPPCRQEMPSLERLHEELGRRRHFLPARRTPRGPDVQQDHLCPRSPATRPLLPVERRRLEHGRGLSTFRRAEMVPARTPQPHQHRDHTDESAGDDPVLPSTAHSPCPSPPAAPPPGSTGCGVVSRPVVGVGISGGP